MASTEELEAQILAEMEANPEAYLVEPVNDILIIDPETRTINVPASEALFGARQDMDAERKYFKCPKIVGDNIDLSKCHIYVSYVPSKQDGTYDINENVGSYLCEDVAVDGDYITFSWKLSGNVFVKAGSIAFSVYAKQADTDGILKTKWHTTFAIGKVLDTLPDGEQIVEKYADVIEQLLNKMENVEQIATPEAMQGYVNEYMDENPPSGMTAEEKAQLQKNTEDISSLSEEIDGLGGGTGGRLEYGIYVGDTQPTNGVMYWLDTSGDSGDDETEVTLSSISATYSGGDVAVGTALTDLTGITVKATYSDGSTANVTDYTLSGTIAEGENTITVSYGGKTTTFVVTGIAESGGGDTNEPILHLTNLVLDGTEESGIDTGVELFENAEDCDWTVAVDFTTALKQGQNVWGANYNGNYVGIDYASNYCLRARYGNGSKNLTMLNATDGEKIIATHTVGQGGATFYYINNGVLESMEVTGTFNMVADRNIVYGGKTSATTFFTGTINDLTAYRKVLSEAEIKAYLGVA